MKEILPLLSTTSLYIACLFEELILLLARLAVSSQLQSEDTWLWMVELLVDVSENVTKFVEGTISTTLLERGSDIKITCGLVCGNDRAGKSGVAAVVAGSTTQMR